MNSLTMEESLDYWISIAPFEVSENDSRSLMTATNKDWTPHTWEELQDAIARKDLSRFTRWPTDMRKYILWRAEMKRTYPDISKFILTQRLGWPLPTERGFDVQNAAPLTNPADYRVLRNDWPYALEPDVSHVVIWLKTRIAVDELGDPTVESKELINAFVERTFQHDIDASNFSTAAEIIWFKNRVQWQSVRSLEHIHVLFRGVDDSLIQKWTGQLDSDTIGSSWSDRDMVITSTA